MEAWQWVLTGVVAVLVAAIIPYLILKYACHKPLQNVWMYILYIFMFWILKDVIITANYSELYED